MKGKVASVVLINENKEILLLLRDNRPDIPHPNLWSFLGGHLEGNETYLEALKREIKEEINYEIKNPIFIEGIDDGVGNIVYIYKDKIEVGIDSLELNEGQKLGFFKFEDIFQLRVPIPLINFLKKNKQKLFY